MRSSITVAFALAAAALVAPAATRAGGPRLTVAPQVALLDAPVAIRLEGLRPLQEVNLRATTTDADGRPWRSEVVFRAGVDGVVDATAERPLRGTYAGVDAMGLFWSMQPLSEPGRSAGAPAPAPILDLLAMPSGTPFPRPVSGALGVRLDARAGNVSLGSALVTRQVTGPDVTVSEVREQGLVGRLYEPKGSRRPAVLVLGGSNGGIPGAYAPVLAGHGYVTFSLAYFRAEGLPSDLVEIPLEYFKRGIDWLRARRSVDAERIAVLGLSRGGEAALLLGATYPELKAVVALAPSHVVWEGAVRDPRKRGLEAYTSNTVTWPTSSPMHGCLWRTAARSAARPRGPCAPSRPAGRPWSPSWTAAFAPRAEAPKDSTWEPVLGARFS